MSTEDERGDGPQRWAQLRFGVVGGLLAAPPPPGELRAALETLAAKTWRHPITGAPTQFGFSTVERWLYQARSNPADVVGVLMRKVRSDCGTHPTIGEPLRKALLQQYTDHRNWSYQLHHDNLKALVAEQPELGPLPSYATVRRFMKENGLFRGRRRKPRTAGEQLAATRLEEWEVRSFEATHVHGLWHLDFHDGSRKVLLPTGRYAVPVLLGILDDRSRLACHLQWYLNENTENLVHGLSQAFQKRGLPRLLLTDRGSAMIAGETTGGLSRLGVQAETTLARSPYQNGKQESFWTQVEGRLLPMLEGCSELTLALLNEATQAWVELEYNRKVHDETGQPPLQRYLAGPDVGRPCPSSETLRQLFTLRARRTLRRSDGTISVEGRRYEVPSRYYHLSRLTVRYARWDLGQVLLVDERTGVVLDRLYPLDKEANADGRRRRRAPGPLATGGGLPTPTATPLAPGKAGMAPLLRQLVTRYAATGLPPAYLPRPEELLASPPGSAPVDPAEHEEDAPDDDDDRDRDDDETHEEVTR